MSLKETNRTQIKGAIMAIIKLDRNESKESGRIESAKKNL